MCCGILRAVGAQFYSSVIMFFSFYVIGASTGFILLLKSTLQVKSCNQNLQKKISKNTYSPEKSQKNSID